MSNKIARKHQKSKSGAHAHVLVAQTARDLCLASYENIVFNNALYDAWKKQNPQCTTTKELELAFVAKYVESYIDVARATLAHMLTLPGDEGLKETISDALILDKTLAKGRLNKTAIVGSI